MQKYDKIIIGAGLYGLYAALFCGRRGMKVLLLEKESAAFTRATYINQARVHMGYHYPRSLATAIRSAGYFNRFCEDYGFCIHRSFDQVYATSQNFSWTDAAQFQSFCRAAGIRCDEISPDKYFRKNMCDGAFLTTEYTYDAMMLRDHFLKELSAVPEVTIQYGASLKTICRDGSVFRITAENGEEYETPFILNATYASVNEIISMIYPEDLFRIKYELCEIILCEPGDTLQNVGLTVMDGPFFSIMPFGLTGFHSLTSVTFTPHSVSYDSLPTFPCQEKVCAAVDQTSGKAFSCCPADLGNCNSCPARPKSAWPYMSRLADKYLKPEFAYRYHQSLFSMKPILMSSEVDDSRPTSIRLHHSPGENGPVLISVLSGKINTVYDLDEYLDS